MQIQLIKDRKRNEIILPPSFFANEEVTPKRAILHYGQWRSEVVVSIDQQFPDNRIGLRKSLFAPFTISDSLNYQLLWDGRNLKLGPVIAFLAISQTVRLEKQLDKFEAYFANAKFFSGIVYICAIDGVNLKNKTVEGFYFDSTAKEVNSKWKKAIFPYPGAVYRKTGFHSALYDEWIQAIGDKMFNTYFFDKWELWDWTSSSEKCKNYLPDTTKLTDFRELDRMLGLHGEIYLKKRNSHKAKGIIKVTKDEAGYHFIYRLRGEKI